MKPIIQITNKYEIPKDSVINYGNYVAKIDYENLPRKVKQGKLILVTATSPTPTGEGKTTISINLTDALNKLGNKSIVALREPSIGPCFGVKGGATGAGKASICPEDKINLHFTGDFHAITTANNLISAIIDNEIYQNSPLKIDPNKIVHKRVMDMNDRSLRDITVTINNTTKYNTSFDITSACELMTIFCLAKNKQDFTKRLENMIVAYDINNHPITVKQLEITKALLSTLEDCFKPNAVQTLEGSLAFVHGGPFANISIGVSTYFATKAALDIADYAITEAGFGSDLGAEKFLNILCQENNLEPSCVVLVTTIKSIYFQGNGDFDEGIKNLDQHIKHLQNYSIPFVIAINQFATDSKKELTFLTNWLKSRGIEYALDTGFVSGSKGGIDLAKKVIKLSNKKITKIKFLYSPQDKLSSKIKTIVNKCYGINNLVYSDEAKKQLKKFDNNGFYVCMSKKPGQIPTNIENNEPMVKVNNILINNASKIAVILCDKVYRMPGLPKIPKAKTWK